MLFYGPLHIYPRRRHHIRRGLCFAFWAWGAFGNAPTPSNTPQTMQLITPTMQVVTNLWQNGENYATIYPTNGGALDPAPPGLVSVYPSNKVRCTIMKVKKLLALVLSAVMAMTMLAACGGGGGGGNSTGGDKVIDIDKINRQVSASVEGAKVEELPELEKGMTAAAQVVAQKNKANIQPSDVVPVIEGYISSVPRSRSVVTTAPNEVDINSKLVQEIIESAPKSQTKVFYVSAREVRTKDGQSYWFFAMITK